VIKSLIESSKESKSIRVSVIYSFDNAFPDRFAQSATLSRITTVRGRAINGEERTILAICLRRVTGSSFHKESG
jgi:hypothetical protein